MYTDLVQHLLNGPPCLHEDSSTDHLLNRVHFSTHFCLRCVWKRLHKRNGWVQISELEEI